MNVQIVNQPAAAPENAIAENRVVLRDIKWQTFKALLADAGDNRAWRIAYDQGVLEMCDAPEMLGVKRSNSKLLQIEETR